MKSNVSHLSALAICLGLAACGGEEPNIHWARRDGQPVMKTPELAQQFQSDGNACKSERTKSGAAANAYEACMTARGYIERK